MPSFWPILAFDMSSSFLVFLLEMGGVCPVLSPERLQATVRLFIGLCQYCCISGNRGPKEREEMGEQ